MKTKHKLTSIAFVVAATLSMGAMANDLERKRPPVVDEPTEERDPSVSSASVLDQQLSMENNIHNENVENNAVVNNSLQDGSGNAGVNVAAGDTNQQANALSISTADADADFVFGNHSAVASVGVGQANVGNTLTNLDVTNNATVTNAANDFSGNLGMNVTAGALNQQKNDASIANATEAQTAEASIEVLQIAAGGNTYNSVEADALTLVASGWGRGGNGGGHNNPPTNNYEVENNATLVGSLNGFSGNAGVNIAAGGTNQQSNALSIAAGCSGCP